MKAGKLFDGTATPEEMAIAGASSIKAVAGFFQSEVIQTMFSSLSRCVAGNTFKAVALPEPPKPLPVNPRIVERIKQMRAENQNALAIIERAEALVDRMRFMTAERETVKPKSETVH